VLTAETPKNGAEEAQGNSYLVLSAVEFVIRPDNYRGMCDIQKFKLGIKNTLQPK
jgi:hypothetical protein